LIARSLKLQRFAALLEAKGSVPVYLVCGLDALLEPTSPGGFAASQFRTPKIEVEIDRMMLLSRDKKSGKKSKKI
jgi:hypothetical protein